MAVDGEEHASLGESLRRHRERGGRSREELAASTDPGISPDTIANVERGRTRPYRQTLLTLCAALGLDEREQAEMLDAWRSLGIRGNPRRDGVSNRADDVFVVGGLKERIGVPGRFAAPLHRYRARTRISHEEPAERASLQGLAHPAVPDVLHPHLPQRTHNLPSRVNRFVGREDAIVELRHLLVSTRLLTLTGTGGIGKTRLALALAEQVLPDYEHGLWLVELASVADPVLVAATAAAVLGVRESGKPLVEHLLEVLRHRAMLLVLDNCEHVVRSCAELAEGLLRGCPELRILATSRQPLNISGEVIWRVPGLTTPEDLVVSNLKAAQETEAVQLFVERASAMAPSFRLTERNSAAVADICRQVEGIPLAIELAAGRTRVLTPQEIASRAGDHFRVLVGGSRIAPRRQQTLRATMDWSYSLLSELERALFSRLSVFVGGCTFEAAEAVCADFDQVGQIRGEDVLDLIGRVVDQSLVVAEPTESGSMHYRLLETVREYGLERLEESGTSEDFRQRHAEYFLRLGEHASAHLRGGPELPAWLESLDREWNNVRTALRWFLRTGEIANGLRLGEAVWPFWQVAGSPSEGREWLEALLGLVDARVPADLRARALNGAAILAREQCNFDSAQRLIEESLAVWDDLGDELQIGAAIQNLGTVALHRGDYPAARRLLEKALAMGRARDDRHLLTHALDNLGWTFAELGDYAAARNAHSESLAIQLELDNGLGAANSLSWLGHWALDQGDLKAARSFSERSLAMSRALGDRSVITFMHTCLDLAIVECQEGSFSNGRVLLDEALAAAETRDYRQATVYCLETCAGAAAFQKQSDRALRLAGMAANQRKTIRFEQTPTERDRLARWLAGCREEMGAAADLAWSEGSAVSLEQAIAYARAQPDVQTRHATPDN